MSSAPISWLWLTGFVHGPMVKTNLAPFIHVHNPTGKDATQKDVDKLVKRLNIQFDNLCQVRQPHRALAHIRTLESRPPPLPPPTHHTFAPCCTTRARLCPGPRFLFLTLIRPDTARMRTLLFPSSPSLQQFLPQDKVQSFAAMDKYELLAATEKALGDASLHDQHQKLVVLRKEEKIATAVGEGVRACGFWSTGGGVRVQGCGWWGADAGHERGPERSTYVPWFRVSRAGDRVCRA